MYTQIKTLLYAKVKAVEFSPQTSHRCFLQIYLPLHTIRALRSLPRRESKSIDRFDRRLHHVFKAMKGLR